MVRTTLRGIDISEVHEGHKSIAGGKFGALLTDSYNTNRRAQIR